MGRMGQTTHFFEISSFRTTKEQQKVRPVSLKQIKDSTNIVDYSWGGTQEKMGGAGKKGEIFCEKIPFSFQRPRSLEMEFSRTRGSQPTGGYHVTIPISLARRAFAAFPPSSSSLSIPHPRSSTP